MALSRRVAREKALQALFQVEVGGSKPVDALRDRLAETSLDEAGKKFARLLVDGTLTHLEEIDYKIKQYAVDWSIDRLANVDRCILRMAIFEMLYLEDIPSLVSINEAVELAKTFGGADSPKFVNALLDNIKNEIGVKP